MARHFDPALNQYLERSGVPVSGCPVTLALWGKLSSTASGFHFFSGGLFYAATTSFISLGDLATGVAREHDGTTNATAAVVPATPLNAWTHYAGVFTTDSLRSVFLNGANKVTDATATTAPPLDHVVVGAGYFGGSIYASGKWDGDLAEFAIWNAALNDAEIAQLATGVAATLVRPGNLVAYYPLLGTSSPEPDVKGGTGLTLVNGPTPAPHPPIITPGAGRMFAVF